MYKKGTEMEEEYVEIGKIDIKKYSKLCENQIITNEVIITYKQIEHINEERPGVFDKYKDKLEDVIKTPDYIIEDPKHKETGLVIKKYEKDVVVVLKLNTSEEDKKNSIITIWEIKEKKITKIFINSQNYLQKRINMLQ